MTTLITEPGVYGGVPETAYHEDRIMEGMTLSCSVALEMARKSPAHAAIKHPRLSLEAPEEADEDRFDKGSAVHELLLGGEGRFAVVDAASWRSDAAKAARAAARKAGKIPLLRRHMDECRLIGDVVRDQFQEHPYLRDLLERADHKECTVVWREDHPDYDFWCRCRPDLVVDGYIVDFKLTGADATPEGWGHRTAWDMGYDFRANFYRRGWAKATGGQRIDYRFVVIENKKPYAISLFEMTEQAFAEAEEGVHTAIEAWGTCLRESRWPGYETEPVWLEPPTWARYRWAAMKGRLDHVIGREKRLAADGQRPLGAPRPSLAVTPDADAFPLDTAAE